MKKREKVQKNAKKHEKWPFFDQNRPKPLKPPFRPPRTPRDPPPFRPPDARAPMGGTSFSRPNRPILRDARFWPFLTNFDVFSCFFTLFSIFYLFLL